MPPSRPNRRYVRFTRWRRRRFFALLEEHGNVRMACELSGVGLGCIYRLRRTEPGFVALMAAAKKKADRRLGRKAPPPPCGRSPSPANAGEDLAGNDLAIRRGIGGRLRAVAVGAHEWTARHDAVFLGYLRATANVTHSAEAAGFTRKSAYNRRRRMPGFARAWDEILAGAQPELAARRRVEAENGGATLEPGAFEPGDPATFDVDAAIRAVQRWEAARRRQERAGRRQ
jgi:hypothetical protein